MDNLNDIISSLSSEDIEMLKGVAGSILNNAGANETPVNDFDEMPEMPISSSPSPNLSQLTGLGLGADDFQMIMKAKQVLDKMNSASTKNTDLINALKPHLTEPSRQKADHAIRIMRLFEALPYIKDLF